MEDPELSSCVKEEGDLAPVPNSLYGLSGRKATLKKRKKTEGGVQAIGR